MTGSVGEDGAIPIADNPLATKKISYYPAFNILYFKLRQREADAPRLFFRGQIWGALISWVRFLRG